jgi:hypothetical protein
MLHYMALYGSIWRYIALWHMAFYGILALCCIMLNNMAVYGIIWHCMTLYGIWHSMELLRNLHYVALYGIIWHYMALYGIMLHIALYGILALCCSMLHYMVFYGII